MGLCCNYYSVTCIFYSIKYLQWIFECQVCIFFFLACLDRMSHYISLHALGKEAHFFSILSQS